DVHPSIVVVVEERATCAARFRQVHRGRQPRGVHPCDATRRRWNLLEVGPRPGFGRQRSLEGTRDGPRHQTVRCYLPHHAEEAPARKIIPPFLLKFANQTGPLGASSQVPNSIGMRSQGTVFALMVRLPSRVASKNSSHASMLPSLCFFHAEIRDANLNHSVTRRFVLRLLRPHSVHASVQNGNSVVIAHEDSLRVKWLIHPRIVLKRAAAVR